MTIQKTKCKICGVELNLEIDHHCPAEWIAKLVPLAVCNRCADFSRARNRLVDRIEDRCGELIHTRMATRPNAEKLDSLFKDFVELTRKYAEIICNYYRAPVYWEPEFAERMMENPSRHETILRLYRGMVYKASRSGTNLTPTVRQGENIP